MLLSQQLVSTGVSVQVSVPRDLFYWAMDPEHFVYVHLGSYTYLAMWESLKSILPETVASRDTQAWVCSVLESHREWMRENIGYGKSADTVTFSVWLPTSYLGRQWVNGETSHSGDFYEVGQRAVLAIEGALSQVEVALEEPSGILRELWLKEWQIEVDSHLLLDDAEALLEGVHRLESG